jgi:hemoglobin
MTTEPTVYDLAGGMPAFERLSEAFYRRVETDPVLRPLYPASLAEPRDRLALFLAQYFGGPNTYSEQRGHPRLRLRHLRFVISQRERDVWVRLMNDALDESAITEPALSEMRAYFADAATFLINQDPPSD